MNNLNPPLNSNLVKVHKLHFTLISDKTFQNINMHYDCLCSNNNAPLLHIVKDNNKAEDSVLFGHIEKITQTRLCKIYEQKYK